MKLVWIYCAGSFAGVFCASLVLGIVFAMSEGVGASWEQGILLELGKLSLFALFVFVVGLFYGLVAACVAAPFIVPMLYVQKYKIAEKPREYAGGAAAFSALVWVAVSVLAVGVRSASIVVSFQIGCIIMFGVGLSAWFVFHWVARAYKET